MSGVAEVSSKYLAEIASNPTPLGYKLTEVGIIPEDWEIFSLPEVIWYQEGPGLRKWQFKSKGLKVINVTNLQESGYLDLDRTDRHISWDEFEKTYKHFACDEGDLVIASSGNSYCKASIVRACDLPLLMNTSVIRFKPIGEFSKGYMEVYLKSPYFKDQIDLLITGGAQPNFGPAHLNLIKIPAPTCAKEQTAIANALSDVDALISELEKLIAKKQAIKTATMQQLLTGRTRLPQFALRDDGTPKGTKPSELGDIPEDWEVFTFADVISFLSSGATPYRGNKSFYKGTIRWITSGELNYCVINDTIEKISDEAVLKTNLKIHPAGTFLMAITGLEAAGTRGACGIVGQPSATNQSCMAIYPNDNLMTQYLYFWYVYNGEELAFKYCQGTKQLSYTAGLIKKIPIYLPCDTGEQTAIATILSDMDAEIQALEQRLGKTRQIKQGMMQELLTGKTRLIQGSEIR